MAQAIASFLIDHDLDVTPANLSLAHAAFSGANPQLARKIGARTRSGEAITQTWLNELAASNGAMPDQADLNRRIARLESNLDTFSTHTKAARTVAHEYGSELEQHVVDLEQVKKTGQLVTNLAGLARAMLERTRKAENDMRKSEDEAKALRRSLARAKRDAEIDYLTGLPNRRAIEVLLEHHYT